MEEMPSLCGSPAAPIPEPQLNASILKEHDVRRKENFKEAGDPMHRKWALRNRKCGGARRMARRWHTSGR